MCTLPEDIKQPNSSAGEKVILVGKKGPIYILTQQHGIQKDVYKLLQVQLRVLLPLSSAVYH